MQGAQPGDAVAVAVGQAEHVLRRLQSESSSDVIEAAVEPIQTDGMALGEGQHVGQVRLVQTEAETIRIGGIDLLSLQGGDGRGVPADGGSVGGDG